MQTTIAHARVWCALTVAILLGGLVFTVDPAGAMSVKEEDTAIRGTVQLIILTGSEKTLGTCSGSNVDPSGYILTAFHCVGITATGKDDTGQNLKPGDLYHPKGKLLVAPTKDERSIPKPVYVANYLAGDPKRDFAVLKITGMLNERETLPNPLPVTVMPMADATGVRISDIVHVLGYPGLGGKLITVTTGRITGFDIEEGDDAPAYFKHDAGTANGHSGGPMVDDKGAQVGVHSRRREAGATAVKFGAMLNVILPYLQQARQLGGVVDPTAVGPTGSTTPAPTQPTTPTQPATGPTRPTPQAGTNQPPVQPGGTTNPPGQTSGTPPGAGTGPFGALRFGTDYQNGNLIGEGTTLPSGTKQIVAAFPYTGMKKGASWGNEWLYNGNVVGGRRDKTWTTNTADGTFAVSLTNDAAFADGSYELVLYAGGREVRRGSFNVGRAGGPTPPSSSSVTPPPQNTGGAIVSGKIVDADTKRGIPGAEIGLFKPGTALATLQAADDITPYLAARGVADTSGNFTATPGLPPGKYPILVAFAGYQPRFFGAGVEITPADGNSVPLETITLQKK